MKNNPAGKLRHMGATAWTNFRLDALGAVLFSVFNVVFNQFYIPIAIRHGASSFEVGLLSAAPAVGLLLSPFWASLMEGRDPKPFVILPNVAGRLLILLPLLYGEPWVFVGTAFLFHLLMGIQAPAYAALVTRIYPAELRGRIMGNVRVAMGVLMIPLAYGVGRWIDQAGETGPLLAATVTGLVSLAVFSRVREIDTTPRTLPASRAKWGDQVKLLKGNPELVLFLTATTLTGFANMLASPLYQIIQVDKLDLTNEQIGYTRMVYFGCLLFAYLLMGWVIDRYSPKTAILFGLAAYTVVPFLYGCFGTYGAVFAGMGMQGFGDAIWDIGCLAYVFRLAPGREGWCSGFIFFCLASGGRSGRSSAPGCRRRCRFRCSCTGPASLRSPGWSCSS
ncbi:MFS transporter [Paenibacillus sp. CC-CFT747]|nr:MFS transporter [Paenibacillus sp. CC-CFT747]